MQEVTLLGLPGYQSHLCSGSASQAVHSSKGVQEVTLLGLLGYLSYLCGDVLGLSGIVSLFCCAVAISHYALHNVNSLSRVTTVSAFQTLSYVSEGAIFIYVGMDALDPIKWTVGRRLSGKQLWSGPGGWGWEMARLDDGRSHGRGPGLLAGHCSGLGAEERGSGKTQWLRYCWLCVL